MLSTKEKELTKRLVRVEFDESNDKMILLDLINISRKLDLGDDFISEMESDYKSEYGSIN